MNLAESTPNKNDSATDEGKETQPDQGAVKKGGSVDDVIASGPNVPVIDPNDLDIATNAE
jgi:hypothetical protein